jgi:DNA-binding NarL/FixJ family response regulator
MAVAMCYDGAMPDTLPPKPKKPPWRPKRGARLSPREKTVLTLIAQGMTDSAIADMLGITRKAVERFGAKLCVKTGAVNRVQLARYAVSEGYVPATRTPPSEAPGEP